jgi:poly(3-hydroxybutyrate) depolymerase
MTSVMLAAYPEVFAGGAIIAGLPYATANSVPEAFDRMRGHGAPGEEGLTALVRAASSHSGPWPSVSIWQGTSDSTVDASNADAILGQWRTLHGVSAKPTVTETVDGYPRKVWTDASGREVIEEYSITGMGHGTPLDPTGEDSFEVAAPYMLDAHISSTRHIARFWGLADEKDAKAAGKASAPKTRVAKPAPAVPPEKHKTAPAPAAAGVGKVIEDALRTAGLMR